MGSQQATQEHEKHGADEPREQAKAYPRVCLPPDRLTPVSRPANVCHAYA